MCLLRILEYVFLLYFVSHIPITILFDSQIVAGDFINIKDYYPEQILNLTKQYVAQFKDPYFVNPPNWYKIFCLSELALQLPYFFVASLAFMLGSRPWIRTSAIIYSTHVATTVAPMLYSFAFDDFSKMNRVGPVTQAERQFLMGVYAPYFIIPLLILLTMLVSDSYTSDTKSSTTNTTGAQKKKHYKSH